MSNRIQGTTRLLGLVGDPIKHSRSPHMHNSACDANGADYAYICFEVPSGEGQLKKVLESYKTLNVAGSNVTFPYKEEVIQYLDHVSKEVEMIGACNTIVIDDETKEITGYNTDGAGLVKAVDELGVDFRGKKVVQYGVGGAGKAIAVMFALEGVGELCICQRTVEKYEAIAATIKEYAPNVKVRHIAGDDATLKEELKDAVLFVNTTTMGYKGHEDECVIGSADVLNPDVFVYDIIYAPAETKLMKFAKEAGAKTCNGISMMLWQGAIAYKHFTGVDMPIDYVKKELGF